MAYCKHYLNIRSFLLISCYLQCTMIFIRDSLHSLMYNDPNKKEECTIIKFLHFLDQTINHSNSKIII